MSKRIKLSHNQHALVDDEDFEFLNQWKWHAKKDNNKSREVFYAVRNEGKTYVAMHRIIMEAPKGMVIDHIDGNTLNNKKCNLRIVSQRENAMNKHVPLTSKYPGVSWSEKSQKWQVTCRDNDHESVYGGLFKTEKEAFETYQWILKELKKGNSIPSIATFTKTSKYKGVHFVKNKNKWCAKIYPFKKQVHVGYFKTEEEAYAAVLKAKKEHGLIK